MNPKNRLWMAIITSLFLLACTASPLPVVAQVSIGAETSKPSKATGTGSPMNTRVADAYGKLPLAFEADQGQTDPRVKFVARGGGYTLFLTDAQAVLALGTAQPNKQNKPRLNEAVVRMKLLGANPKSIATGIDELPGKSNYFIGNDPKKWRHGCAELRAGEISEYLSRHRSGLLRQPGPIGIRLPGRTRLRSQSDHLEGRSRARPAKPGAGEVPLQIDPQWRPGRGPERRGDPFPQAGRLSRCAGQDFAIEISERKFIDARYVLEAKNQVGIRLSAYDATRPLVIDPVIWYSSHLGGSSTDQAAAIAVDSAGNVYVAGYTQSVDFPR